jgi:hypothetical protein
MRTALSLLSVAALALAGCDTLPVSAVPADGDAGPLLAEAQPAAPAADDDALTKFYARAERELIAAGRMRTDVAPADAPVTLDALVETFVRVALYDEFAVASGRFVPSQSPSRLRRWETPVRIGLVFGNSVGSAQIADDARAVSSFARRLSSISGHPVTMTEGTDANFTVLFLNRAEQRAFGEDIALSMPEIPDAVVNAFRDSPPEAFCVAYTFGSAASTDTYVSALILVKAEHRGLMRLSCIHEEIAQAMGLANDSPDARPSIFNDDEEFALLTRHDEILLRMLYDRRLRPGMTEAEARPLLGRIAAEAAASLGVSLKQDGV